MENFLQLIEAKRDGRPLEAKTIQEAVAAYTSGAIPDYQMAAFLMAVCFRGLEVEETRALTLAMRDSGELLVFPPDPRPLVDKHSTGGVGDKVSLVLAPLLACLGFRVPMISGRGLGITGGTLDKLDSIPGLQTALTAASILEAVQSTGCVICGQTERMVPADKKLYALRDVTGTVPSIPLIVASILSKKMAESIQALVLDVKFGAAAFMATQQQARDLARRMVQLGNSCGIRTRALLTRMDTPIGRAAGNWLEVKEATRLLEEPRAKGLEDLEELVVESAAHLLVLADRTAELGDARQVARDGLRSGEAEKKWRQMLEGQGANMKEFRRKLERDSCAGAVAVLTAAASGWVCRCDARVIGETVRDLGAGRLTKDSALDYHTGVDQLAKPGDEVSQGAVLARIHARDADAAQKAVRILGEAFEVCTSAPEQNALVAETVEA